MKPLFLTFSNSKELYLTLAKKLGESIKKFDAGDFQSITVHPPGGNIDFFTTSACLVYSYIIKAITLRPLIVLDCDHELKKSLPSIFEADWDIAVNYRSPQSNENGRQDYNGGLVALNNKRPDVIRSFWVEWIDKAELWEKPDLSFFPETLKIEGWKQSWFSKQSSLNQIILPEGNQGVPEEDSYRVVPGEIYETHGYKILPLERRIYGARPDDSGDACIIHYKGKAKRREPEDIECKT